MRGQTLDKAIEQPSLLAAYASASKPGIVGLTLVAALTGIYFGNHGLLPDWSLIFWTFLTLGLATAGSCILNNVYDRDIDRVMKRTSERVLASNILDPGQAVVVGLMLMFGSLAVMAMMVNPLTAAVTAVGALGYVGLYTMIMKRRTPWANQFGGIAGAVPPMVGYAAVTNELGAAAWVLFAIMVVWQQPHALSLALKYREDYARAGVPVIPVACGVAATKVRIAIYTLLLFPVVYLPYYFEIAGSVYLSVAMVLTAVFCFLALRFLRCDKNCDMRLFAYSIIYLIVLFGALVMDAIV